MFDLARGFIVSLQGRDHNVLLSVCGQDLLEDYGKLLG